MVFKLELFCLYLLDSISDLDRLIPKYTKLLNKNHWLVIEAKQNFIALLRMREDVKHNMLIKKLKYCEEINEAIQKFEPYISRFRGISLYETFKTLNQICGEEFESDMISEEQLAVTFMLNFYRNYLLTFFCCRKNCYNARNFWKSPSKICYSSHWRVPNHN